MCFLGPIQRRTCSSGRNNNAICFEYPCTDRTGRLSPSKLKPDVSDRKRIGNLSVRAVTWRQRCPNITVWTDPPRCSRSGRGGLQSDFPSLKAKGRQYGGVSHASEPPDCQLIGTLALAFFSIVTSLRLRIWQNADGPLETCAGGCASAIGHPLVFHAHVRASPPPIHDDAVQQANTRDIALPALD